MLIIGGKLTSVVDAESIPGTVASSSVDGAANHLSSSKLQAVFRNSTEATVWPDSSGGDALVHVVALLVALLSVALIIILIALFISKMRRRQASDAAQTEDDMPPDPYLQAIMFPSEPRPEWQKHLKQLVHKLSGKPQHECTIPEDLKYQLKQIYVY